MPNLGEKWHGAPLYVWYGGAGLLGGVGWYVYKTRKAKASAASTGTSGVDTTGASDLGGSVPSGGGGVSGGGQGSQGQGPLPDWWQHLGDFLPPVPPATTTPVSTPVSTFPTEVTPVTLDTNPAPPLAPKGSTDVANALQEVQNVVQQIAAATPVPVPQPAPPPPTVTPLPGWQAAASLAPAPPGTTAVPISIQGQTIGENFVPNNDTVSVTAPWQQALGLAPATPAENATPIIAQGQTIGESFTPGSSAPAPSLFGPTPIDPNSVVYNEYGPLTRAQAAVRGLPFFNDPGLSQRAG